MLTAVLILQSCIFACFIFFGGTVDRLNQNALDILNQQVINRKNYLENEMIQRWSNLAESQETIQQVIKEYLDQNAMTAADLTVSSDDTVQLLLKLSDPLLYLLRKNAVTGVFLIFDGQGTQAIPAESAAEKKAGLYLRDMDPSSTSADNSDILLERGSALLSRKMNIAMNSSWAPIFTMKESDDYYFKPLFAARQYPDIGAQDLGHWSRTFYLGDNADDEVLTYSQPLLDENNQVYGVLGVEITVDYLRKLLPYDELSQGKSAAYLLAMPPAEKKETIEFYGALSSGPIVKRIFGDTRIFPFDSEAIHNSIYPAKTDPERTKQTMYGSIQYLNLYNSNTPFEQERWALIGLVEKDSVFSFSQKMLLNMLTFLSVALILGAFCTFWIGYFIAKPFRVLARKVRQLDPTSPIKLDKINVTEIDELSSSIELLSQDVADAASRLSQIIELADVSLGAFELNQATPYAYFTKDFFSILGWPEQREKLSKEEFVTKIKELEQYKEESLPDEQTTLYRIPDQQGNDRWLRLKMIWTESSSLGVVVDISEEIREKKKIEYERDYDLLTNLLNRRAFQTKTGQLEKTPEKLKIGALIMMDLDNLKYINDTYGHDYGDEYIRCTADVLRECAAYNALVARMSGDEFYLFFYGYEDQKTLENVIQQMREKMAATSLPLPDGGTFRLRASAGVAWYPKDSTSISELIRFADFAMYEVKNAIKGGLRNFDIGSYRRDAFLLHSREELNHLIDEKLVDYVFQPIVSCSTGEIIGHEALMRPHSKTLSNPLDVLRIARSQFKLYQIEKLTWFQAPKVYFSLPNCPKTGLVFINSIASQALTREDCAEFDRQFGAYLDRIVVELTEGEERNKEATQYKLERREQKQIRLALDDFGTGYSSDSVLLDLNPDFVKIDMSIIRQIDQDKSRQALFRNVANFCHAKNIQVIAEGVETKEELRTLVALGADHLQGYFLGKPEPSFLPLSPEVLEAIRDAWTDR